MVEMAEVEPPDTGPKVAEKSSNLHPKISPKNNHNASSFSVFNRNDAELTIFKINQVKSLQLGA